MEVCAHTQRMHISGEECTPNRAQCAVFERAITWNTICIRRARATTTSEAQQVQHKVSDPKRVFLRLFPALSRRPPKFNHLENLHPLAVLLSTLSDDDGLTLHYQCFLPPPRYQLRKHQVVGVSDQQRPQPNGRHDIMPHSGGRIRIR